MSTLRVLIVGASIAGPMSAYWFARAGAIVTVIERFPELRAGGQNIDIRTTGVTVMRKAPGMLAAVQAKVMKLDGLSFVRDDGSYVGTIRSTGNPDQQSLLSEYEIFRGDLSRVLYDMTKDNENIKYVFGEQVSSIQQNEKVDGPVTVEFANGLLSTSQYDLVVACDGATGRTRAMGLNCGAREHMTPINCWAAYFSIDKDLINNTNIGHGYSATPGLFVGVGPDPTGAGINKVSLMSIHPPTDTTSLPLFRDAQKSSFASNDNTALQAFVTSRFRTAGWHTPTVLDCMTRSPDFYASELCQVHPPTLSKGRFTMVGDAGYAPGPTGLGTTLALTGAYLLAGEILKHGSHNIAAGLRGYEEQMRPLITDGQKIPPGVPGIMAPQSRWALWLRNQIFGWVAWSGLMEKAQSWFASGFAENKHRLPDYDWVN